MSLLKKQKPRDLIKNKMHVVWIPAGMVTCNDCQLSLGNRTGRHSAVPESLAGDRRQQPPSDDVECPDTPRLPVITSNQCLRCFHSDCPNVRYDHSIICVWLPLISHCFHLAPHFSPFLFIFITDPHPSTPWQGVISGHTSFIFGLIFPDWQFSQNPPFICMLRRFTSHTCH